METDSEIGAIKNSSAGKESRKSENFPKAEKVCRICHLGTGDSSGKVEIIPLGCDCKGEIGFSHPHCIETWFSLKGNRLCEICGKEPMNIRMRYRERAREGNLALLGRQIEYEMMLITDYYSTREEYCSWPFFMGLLLIFIMLVVTLC